jgi:hypothetical protein
MEEGNRFGVKEGLITPKIGALVRCLRSRYKRIMWNTKHFDLI